MVVIDAMFLNSRNESVVVLLRPEILIPKWLFPLVLGFWHLRQLFLQLLEQNLDLLR